MKKFYMFMGCQMILLFFYTLCNVQIKVHIFVSLNIYHFFRVKICQSLFKAFEIS
jgi:hypothetical protein